MKFRELPWWTRVVVYGVIFGVLTALLEPYKPPRTPLLNGLIAGAVFILLFAPVMFWLSRRRARKAVGATGKSGSAAV